MWNYVLPVVIAFLGTFNLFKDWEGHKHIVRRVSVLVLLWAAAVVSIINTHAERNAAAHREEANKTGIEHLGNELTQANGKLEYQKGQLSTIAALLKSNSSDPAVLAAVISQALHPPEKSPCLKPVQFAQTKRQSTGGEYETLLDVVNHNGFKAGTTFQAFFDGTARYMKALVGGSDVSSSGGAGSNIAALSINREIPKGQKLQFIVESSFRPLDVKCVDRFEPVQH